MIEKSNILTVALTWLKWFFNLKNHLFLVLIFIVIAGGIFFAGMRFEVYLNIKNGLAVFPKPIQTQSKTNVKNNSNVPVLIDGIVLKIDSQNLTVKSTQNQNQNIAYDDKTVVLANNKNLKVDAIKVNDAVRIYLRLSGNNTKIASRILIITPKK